MLVRPHPAEVPVLRAPVPRVQRVPDRRPLLRHRAQHPRAVVRGSRIPPHALHPQLCPPLPEVRAQEVLGRVLQEERVEAGARVLRGRPD